MNPLVSIVLCSYNGAKYIEEQIESLLNQTYTPIEIIVCDDYSTDDTIMILERLANNDNRISIYKNEQNIGLNKNFEKACQLAKGDFISICDQDDIWRNNKIEKLISLFTNDEIILCHSQSTRFTDKIPDHIKTYNKRNLLVGNDARQLFYFNTIAGHNIMFRKKLLQFALPFPSNVFYDWWICMVACCYGNIAATNEVLSFHRSHDNNVTLGKKDEKKQTRSKAIERTEAAKTFLKIDGMKKESNVFGKKLLSKLLDLEKNKFSFKLFLFLLTNANTVFFFKKGNFPFLSHLKISYRLSFAK